MGEFLRDHFILYILAMAILGFMFAAIFTYISAIFMMIDFVFTLVVASNG
jgi:hypothetical protein